MKTACSHTWSKTRAEVRSLLPWMCSQGTIPGSVKTKNRTRRVLVESFGGIKGKTDGPSFGFHLSANSVGLMAGMFGFPTTVLGVYRDAVADETLGSELEKALDVVLSEGQYEISGEHYQRVPSGYDSNHKRAKLLRYNALYVHTKVTELDTLESANLVDTCLEHFRVMSPVFNWLNKVVQST